MIDLYYWTTPNGHKITIFLEEAKLEYKLFPINIGNKEQFKPEFLRISPNNKIPAIVDHKPLEGKEPLTIFESGAILWYLANKSKQFLSDNIREKMLALEWIFWQTSGLGPMAGQVHYFTQSTVEPIPHAIERYLKETARLYSVLDKHLAHQSFITGQYSIADMSCYPWVAIHERHQQDLNQFPNIKRWFESIQKRPAVQRAYQIAEDLKNKMAAASGQACPLPERKS